MEQSIHRLQLIVAVAPKLLGEISEESFSKKPAPAKWSSKEILGHLIDSATNNHHRFVRGQFEVIPEISYDQNNWTAFNFYQEIAKKQLIEFWTIYNQHIIEVIKKIHPSHLTKQVKIGENLFDLKFLIDDYIRHLEHHLHQIIDY